MEEKIIFTFPFSFDLVSTSFLCLMFSVFCSLLRIDMNGQKKTSTQMQKQKQIAINWHWYLIFPLEKTVRRPYFNMLWWRVQTDKNFSSLISCFSRFCLLVSLLLAIMAQGTISLAILILGSCYLLSSHLIQNPFSLQEQAILANAKLSDLPFRMQVALRRRPKTGDNSWVMIYY